MRWIFEWNDRNDAARHARRVAETPAEAVKALHDFLDGDQVHDEGCESETYEDHLLPAWPTLCEEMGWQGDAAALAWFDAGSWDPLELDCEAGSFAARRID